MAQGVREIFDPIGAASANGTLATEHEPTVLEALKARAKPRTVLDEIKARAAAPTAGERVGGAAANLAGGLAQPPIETFLDAPSIAGRWIAQHILPDELAAQLPPAEATILGRLAKGAQKALDGLIPESVKNEPPGMGRFLTTTLPQGIGSTGGFLAAAGGGGLMAAAISGAATNGAAAYHEALASGSSEKTAMLATLLAGGVGTTEALNLEGILARVVKGPGGELVKHALTTGGGEFLQESGQQALGNVIAQNLYDEDRKTLEGVLESGGAGFLSGVLLSALGSSIGRARSLADQKAGRPEESAKNLRIVEPAPFAVLPEGNAPPVRDLTGQSPPPNAGDVALLDQATSEQRGGNVEATSALQTPAVEPASEPTLLESVIERAKPSEALTPRQRIAERNKAKRESADLADWVALQGGISLSKSGRMSGEAEALRQHFAGEKVKFGSGPVVHGPKSKRGASLEQLIPAAIEAGFFPGREFRAGDTSNVGDVTVDEFIDALKGRRLRSDQADLQAQTEQARVDREQAQAEEHYAQAEGFESPEAARQAFAQSFEPVPIERASDALLGRFKSANQIEDVQIVEPTTPTQRYAAEFLKQRGAELVLVDAGRKLALPGVYGEGRVILDAQRGSELKALAFHEITHRLASELPGSYQGLFLELAKADPEGLRSLGEHYRARFERASGETLSRKQLAEEATAFYSESIPSYLEQAFEKPERLARIAEHNPGLARRIVDHLVRLLRRIRLGMGLSTSQEKALRALKSELARTEFEKALPAEVALRAAQTIAGAVNELRGSQTSVAASEGMPFAADELPEMPKGRVIGQDITGQPIYEKIERGALKRPSEGLKKPKATQLGAFDEMGGLFEKQAEERDRGSMFAAAQDELGFFSQLENVLDSKLPARASSKQVLDVARSGAKAEELEWSGLEEWLKDKPSVKKQDVLAFLRENNVQVREVTRGGGRNLSLDQAKAVLARGGEIHAVQRANENYVSGATLDSGELMPYIQAHPELYFLREGNPDATIRGHGPEGTKFHSYQLPGGKNYQEVLLTLPPKQGPGMITDALVEERARKEARESGEDWENLGPNGRQAFQNAALLHLKHEDAQARSTFTSGHFDEPNVLAHVRLNERTDSEGRKTLFLEELQSDWHQKGRKGGYARPLTSERRAELDARRIEIENKGRAATPEERAEWAEIKADLDPERVSRVPDAPFKSTWHELALKRMVRLAAEKGYDALAWTTGEQQAARYDLSKHVEVIEWRKAGGYTIDAPKFDISVKGYDGREIVGRSSQTPAEMTEIFGKDPTDKILEQSAPGTGTKQGELSGLDLKVGGEGMKGFYDKILVAAANKIGKRFGSRVEDVGLIPGQRGTESREETRLSSELLDAGLEASEVDWIDANWGRGGREKAFAAAPEAVLRYEKGVLARVHSLPITDEMRDSVMREGFPRFAVAGTEGEQGFDVPEEGKWRRFYSGMVADFDRLEQLEKAAPVKAKGETLEQSLSLFPGRKFGELEKLDVGFVEPLKKLLRRSNVQPITGTEELPSASDFLYALHAPARNALMAERHPRKFGSESNPGSGMSNSEAAAIVKAALASPKASTYQKIQDWNRRLVEKRLDVLTESGLLSADERAAWEQFGPDFVPLRTATDPMERLFPTSASLAVRGKESQRAEGRSSRADSPLVFALSRTQEAIERAERNRVGQKLAEIVRANPDGPWRIETDRNAVQEGEETLSFKENGQQAFIVTSDKGLAEGFKRIQNPDPGVLRVVDPLMSYLHKVIIQYNPVFPLTNMPRDVGTAAIKGAIKGDKTALAVIARALPAAKGAFRAIKSEEAQGKWEDVYRDARDAGALIGWAQQFSFEERARDFEKAVTRQSRARAFGKLMDGWNRSTELGTRLAVYDALLRTGKTKSEAAMGARRVTADFARRGRWAPIYRRLYLFSGANVQGTDELVRVIGEHPARASAVLGGLVAAGFGLAAASMSWGDDKEREKLTEDDKARFMGVMVGKKRYGTAAPYGYNAFLYLGWKLAEVVLEDADKSEATGNVASAALDAFSPLPRGANTLQSLTPTLARPAVEIEQNRDFGDRPIAPDVDPFDPSPPPNADRFFRGISPLSKGVAQGLYAGSGEMIDVSPEWIDHLAKAATGGLGMFAGRTQENLRKWVQGETDWARPAEWPIVGPATRAFVQQPYPGAESRLYYEMRTKIDEANDRQKAGRELSDRQKLLLAHRPALLRTENVLRKLRAARKTASEADAATLDQRILEAQVALHQLVSEAQRAPTQKP